VKPPKRVILLIPSAREFDRGLRRGIFEYAHTHGPWVFHEEAPPYLQRLSPAQRLRHMTGWNAQGMIVVQSRFAEVKALRIPTVIAIGTHTLPTSVSQVVCADEQIGRVGANTLIGLGLRQFAYCGLEGLAFSDNRGHGFKQAVDKAGFSASVYTSSTQHLGQSWYVEQKLLARWLTDLRKPIGLMACNDDRARMVAEICRMQGIRVPDEVAILGVDNDEQVCRSASPPLSSIAMATERGGYEAAALLASMMAGQAPPRRVVTVHPTHEVPRQSTDILTIKDPSLVRALRLIRENTSRQLRVSHLAAAAGVSRRKLQDQFLLEVGRTPMEEIHRCRVDRIGRLLLDTNMTVGEIALACGFEVDAHLARFFSRHTGMTPSAYRKKMRLT
jgi:LacI family transcriptional regulator